MRFWDRNPGPRSLLTSRISQSIVCSAGRHKEGLKHFIIPHPVVGESLMRNEIIMTTDKLPPLPSPPPPCPPWWRPAWCPSPALLSSDSVSWTKQTISSLSSPPHLTSSTGCAEWSGYSWPWPWWGWRWRSGWWPSRWGGRRGGAPWCDIPRTGRRLLEGERWAVSGNSPRPHLGDEREWCPAQRKIKSWHPCNGTAGSQTGSKTEHGGEPARHTTS